MSRNKYVGPRSCYAVNEGAYVEDLPGFWDELPGVLALILRDARRGFSYGDNCEVIPFDERYALSRGVYAAALASPGRPEEVRRELQDLVREALESGRVPPGLKVRLAGPRARELAEELVSLGIVRRRDVSVRVAERA